MQPSLCWCAAKSSRTRQTRRMQSIRVSQLHCQSRLSLTVHFSVTAFSEVVQPPTLPFHIGFLAASDFYDKEQRLPGASTAFTHLVASIPDKDNAIEDVIDVDSDSAQLRVAAKKLAARFGADIEDEDVVEVIENAADEMCVLAPGCGADSADLGALCSSRAAHSSLPSTSALMGGIVAQEAIKLITRQYIPADNTVVYDGIKQASGVFKL